MRKSTGLYVKIQMNKKGMTQTALAKAVGTSHTRLSQWMNGHDIPSDRIIRKVSDELGLPFEQLRLAAERERFERDSELLKLKYAEVLSPDFSIELSTEID